MRYGPDHKGEARTKILNAAGRGFRRLGFGGIGVDGLAKEAGVTSGAFYGHFPSKAEAFKAAAVAGLVQLRDGVESLQASEGSAWLEKFVDFYLSVRRTCDLGESCALQSLTPEVTRADRATPPMRPSWSRSWRLWRQVCRTGRRLRDARQRGLSSQFFPAESPSRVRPPTQRRVRRLPQE
jgi:AcrR family transcriptional regulator